MRDTIFHKMRDTIFPPQSSHTFLFSFNLQFQKDMMVLCKTGVCHHTSLAAAHRSARIQPLSTKMGVESFLFRFSQILHFTASNLIPGARI